MDKPKNLKHLVDDYLLPVSEYLVTEDMATMSVLMQSSRFLCWNRIKMQGQRGLEPCSLYALNFAPSGAGKDISVGDVADICKKPFEEMAQKKNNDYRRRKEEFISFQTGKDKLITTEKQLKKELWWHNTFSGGTIQGMYAERAKMSLCSFGSLHFESSEFLDSLKNKNSDNIPIFSYMKEAYAQGNTRTDSIMGEVRDNIDDLAMTMYLHGSSMGLTDDKNFLSGFLNIFGTGIARRSFLLFSKEKNNKEYSPKETVDMLYKAETNKSKAESIMYNMHRAVFEKKIIINGYNDIFDHVLAYKNECKKRWSQVDNEILSPEIKDRHWKALRLSACVAMIEHPESLKITKEDFEYAKFLTEKWGRQFENFINGQTGQKHFELYDLILNNPRIGRTKIRTTLNYGNDTRSLNADLACVQEMIEDKKGILYIEKGRGIAEFYSLIPSHLIDEHEYNMRQKNIN